MVNIPKMSSCISIRTFLSWDHKNESDFLGPMKQTQHIENQPSLSTGPVFQYLFLRSLKSKIYIIWSWLAKV